MLNLIRILSFVFCISNVLSQKTANTGNISYKSECLGVELDGSNTLKAWGNGRNYNDASEQAKKNAVRDVIFNGIISGSSECNSLPIISNQSVKFDKEEYFYSFFADNGKYLQFVSLKDERVMSKIKRDKVKNGDTRTHSVVVRVNRFAIKQQLIKDGIIK